ncbi:hypothetical protein HHI36_013490 [Cryptolaemus montrouzieri]|uniref:Uncharacterized protein n=1 Tax=Cryptolaemus montrouzieri TaxID=559131 RepID=A0ABD2NIB5_9CUCU
MSNPPRTISRPRLNSRQSQTLGEKPQPQTTSDQPHSSPEEPRVSREQLLVNIIHNVADSLSLGDDEPYAHFVSSYQPSDSGESSVVNSCVDSDGHITTKESNQNDKVSIANLDEGTETWGPWNSDMNDFY